MSQNEPDRHNYNIPTENTTSEDINVGKTTWIW